jgi:hypothetical protein
MEVWVQLCCGFSQVESFFHLYKNCAFQQNKNGIDIFLGFLTKTAKKVKKATFKKSKKTICESPKLHKFLWLKNPPKSLLKIQTQKKQTQGFQESFLLVSESKFVLLKTVGVQLFFQKKSSSWSSSIG